MLNPRRNTRPRQGFDGSAERKTPPRPWEKVSSTNARGRTLDLWRCAWIWLPYGGPPEEIVFESFGMTNYRFVEALWSAAERVGVSDAERWALAAVYPRPRHQRVEASHSRTASAN